MRPKERIETTPNSEVVVLRHLYSGATTGTMASCLILRRTPSLTLLENICIKHHGSLSGAANITNWKKRSGFVDDKIPSSSKGELWLCVLYHKSPASRDCQSLVCWRNIIIRGSDHIHINKQAILNLRANSVSRVKHGRYYIWLHYMRVWIIDQTRKLKKVKH